MIQRQMASARKGSPLYDRSCLFLMDRISAPQR